MRFIVFKPYVQPVTQKKHDLFLYGYHPMLWMVNENGQAYYIGSHNNKNCDAIKLYFRSGASFFKTIKSRFNAAGLTINSKLIKLTVTYNALNQYPQFQPIQNFLSDDKLLEITNLDLFKKYYHIEEIDVSEFVYENTFFMDLFIAAQDNKPDDGNQPPILNPGIAFPHNQPFPLPQQMLLERQQAPLGAPVDFIDFNLLQEFGVMIDQGFGNHRNQNNQGFNNNQNNAVINNNNNQNNQGNNNLKINDLNFLHHPLEMIGNPPPVPYNRQDQEQQPIQRALPLPLPVILQQQIAPQIPMPALIPQQNAMFIDKTFDEVVRLIEDNFGKLHDPSSYAPANFENTKEFQQAKSMYVTDDLVPSYYIRVKACIPNDPSDNKTITSEKFCYLRAVVCTINERKYFRIVDTPENIKAFKLLITKLTHPNYSKLWRAECSNNNTITFLGAAQLLDAISTLPEKPCDYMCSTKVLSDVYKIINKESNPTLTPLCADTYKDLLSDAINTIKESLKKPCENNPDVEPAEFMIEKFKLLITYLDLLSRDVFFFKTHEEQEEAYYNFIKNQLEVNDPLDQKNIRETFNYLTLFYSGKHILTGGQSRVNGKSVFDAPALASFTRETLQGTIMDFRDGQWLDDLNRAKFKIKLLNDEVEQLRAQLKEKEAIIQQTYGLKRKKDDSDEDKNESIYEQNDVLFKAQKQDFVASTSSKLPNDKQMENQF